MKAIMPAALLAVLLLVLVPAAAGDPGSVGPVAALSYPPRAPITLWNNASVSTGTFEQNLSINSATFSPYINGNWTNVRFQYPNGTAIPAWIESGNSASSSETTVWLRLDPLPPRSTSTLYMVFDPLTTFDLSRGGPVGEAPTLSPVYGEYDDGAVVFPVYENFSGTTVPSGWSFGGNAPTYAIANGLSFWDGNLANGGQTYAELTYSAPGGLPVPNAVDVFARSLSPLSNYWNTSADVEADQANASCPYAFCGGAGLSHNSTTLSAFGWRGGPGGANPLFLRFSGLWEPGVPYVSTAIETGTALVGQINYRTFYSGPNRLSATPAASWPQVSVEYPMKFLIHWVRERSIPPGSPAPAYSIPSVSVPTQPTVLSVTSTSPSAVALAWDNPAGVFLNDTVLSGPSCSLLSPAVSTGGPSTSATVSGLEPATSYAFAVEAWDPTGASGLSNCIYAVTQQAPTPPTQFFTLVSGIPTSTPWSGGSLFAIPEELVHEPDGVPATSTETRQAWQGLTLSYVSNATVRLTGWSVPEWTTAYLTLSVNLTNAQVSAIEGGTAFLELSANVTVSGVAVPASGAITASTLDSATLPGGWWVAWFGMPTPPPPVNSIEGAFAFLAWMDQSVTGRALYMLVTLVAVTIYVYEAHRLAKSKIVGHPARKPEAA